MMKYPQLLIELLSWTHSTSCIRVVETADTYSVDYLKARWTQHFGSRRINGRINENGRQIGSQSGISCLVGAAEPTLILIRIPNVAYE